MPNESIPVLLDTVLLRSFSYSISKKISGSVCQIVMEINCDLALLSVTVQVIFSYSLIQTTA